jgi:cytochrome P450
MWPLHAQLSSTNSQALAPIPGATLGEAYWRERGPFLARLYAAMGPIVRAQLGRTEVVFLLGPAANQFVLQTHRHAFSYREGWGWIFNQTTEPASLLTMDEPEHGVHRRIMRPALTARRLAGYHALLARIIDRRLASWLARGVVDLYEESRVITFDAVAEALLAVGSGRDLMLWRAVYLHGAHRRRQELTARYRQLIAQRRLQPADDVLGLLAQATDTLGQPLDDAQIIAHADTLLVAGHETSASLAAWAMYLLAEHPAYHERICAELADLDRDPEPSRLPGRQLPLIEYLLSEAERLYPPIPIAARGIREAVVFAGHTLPAGTKVFYSAAATHLLPEIWQEPASFDPDRFAPPREEHRKVPYTLVGFGGGPRVCIGFSFARYELALLLSRIATLFLLTTVPGQTIVQRYGVTSRPRHGIRVWVQPRSAFVATC